MTAKLDRRALATASLGILLLAASSTAVLAYINGGIPENDRYQRQHRLEADGWIAGFGEPMHGNKGEVLPGIAVGTPKFDEFVNQLVARAVTRAQKEGILEPPIEIKRQIADAARNTLSGITEGYRERIVTGTAGGLEYNVGMLQFHRWYRDVGRRGDRGRTYPAASGFIPFVAVRAVDRPALAELPWNR